MRARVLLVKFYNCQVGKVDYNNKLVSTIVNQCLWKNQNSIIKFLHSLNFCIEILCCLFVRFLYYFHLYFEFQSISIAFCNFCNRRNNKSNQENNFVFYFRLDYIATFCLFVCYLFNE